MSKVQEIHGIHEEVPSV